MCHTVFLTQSSPSVQGGWQNYNILSAYTHCYSKRSTAITVYMLLFVLMFPSFLPLVRADVIPRDESNITVSRGGGGSAALV